MLWKTDFEMYLGNISLEKNIDYTRFALQSDILDLRMNEERRGNVRRLFLFIEFKLNLCKMEVCWCLLMATKRDRAVCSGAVGKQEE